MGCLVKASGVVGQGKVKVGHIDMRFIPVDQGNPICIKADIARVGIAMDHAGRASS
jgi:hypothetical protein